jgi:hypothetical protein
MKVAAVELPPEPPFFYRRGNPIFFVPFLELTDKNCMSMFNAKISISQKMRGLEQR